MAPLAISSPELIVFLLLSAILVAVKASLLALLSMKEIDHAHRIVACFMAMSARISSWAWVFIDLGDFPDTF